MESGTLHAVKALLLAMAVQETPEELIELLQEFQIAVEAEAVGTAAQRAARGIAAAGAASRMDSPAQRQALWEALEDSEGDPRERLAIVEALSRMGDLSQVGRMLTALTQIRASGQADSGRVEAAEARLRTKKTAPATRSDATPRRGAPPMPKPDENETTKRNWILGGAGLLLAALLLLVRKGR